MSTPLDLGKLAALGAWALLGAACCGYFFGAPIVGVPAGLVAALLWKRYRFAPRVLVRLPGVLELECYWLVRRQRPGERGP